MTPLDAAEIVALAERVEKLSKPCGMCFGTGVTPRYRGPTREGPCPACNGLRARAALLSDRGEG